jgi:CrcB protein
MSLKTRLLIAVFAGGCIGTLLRAAGTELWPPGPGEWPWPTFVANLSGALILGAVSEWWAEHHDRRSLLGGGLCGALTTFSTMQLELLIMLDNGDGGLAALYAGTSLFFGFQLASIGRRIVVHPSSPRRQST